MKKCSFFLSLVLLALSCTEKNEDKNFVSFEPDIRLFTSYAFMNAAGYDHDWLDEMHPIRVEVRSYLDSILSPEYKEKISEYYSQLGGGYFYGYGASALHLGFPPGFEALCDTCEYEYLEEFNGYDSVLRDFYARARIEKLWDLYKDRLKSMNLAYKPFAEIALRQITDFCRVDSDFYRKIADKMHYQEMPLISHWTAFYTEVDHEYWIVSGPSTGDPGPDAFYHESLHRIINPIVDKNQALNQKVIELVPLSQEKLKGDYNDETGLLYESFVRTIDKILSARYYSYPDSILYDMIENEYRLGHILCFFLLENLPEYEDSELTLEEYYPALLSGLDVQHEMDRWQEYWANQK